MTPLRIFRVFARDVGAKVFVILMTKCLVDLVSASFKSLFGKGEPEADLERFAESLGLSLAQIEKLKDSLE